MENQRDEIERLKKWSKFIFRISLKAKESFEIVKQGESIDFTVWKQDNERIATLFNHFLGKEKYSYSIKTAVSSVSLVEFFIEDSNVEAFEEDMKVAGKYLNNLFRPAIKEFKMNEILIQHIKWQLKLFHLQRLITWCLKRKRLFLYSEYLRHRTIDMGIFKNQIEVYGNSHTFF
jgi:hypothetical protein